jgi:TetR/AcrR family transcriptional repressor of nem operon
MARPREFIRTEALQKAIEVFWTHGYDATSMTDLQKGLGIGRQSLYNTFGDKHQLFHEALDHYVSMSEADFACRFDDEAGIEVIREHFRLSVQQLTAGEPRRGCLIMNTGIERAPHDAHAASLVERGLGCMHRSFSRALHNARDRGEIAGEMDVESVAAALTAQNAGLAVMGRSGASAELLLRSANAMLDALVGAAR